MGGGGGEGLRTTYNVCTVSGRLRTGVYYYMEITYKLMGRLRMYFHGDSM